MNERSLQKNSIEALVFSTRDKALILEIEKGRNASTFYRRPRWLIRSHLSTLEYSSQMINQSFLLKHSGLTQLWE